jgi:hypothetical protein
VKQHIGYGIIAITIEVTQQGLAGENFYNITTTLHRKK